MVCVLRLLQANLFSVIENFSTINEEGLYKTLKSKLKNFDFLLENVLHTNANRSSIEFKCNFMF